MESKTNIRILQERIVALLDAGVGEESAELVELLAKYWAASETEFGTKMEAWKAKRIVDIHWTSPVLEFRIERHPSAWNRVQRWAYDFDSNQATRMSEWSPPLNEPYTKRHANKDAKQIVSALLEGSPHPCIEKTGDYYRIWMGRLPQTKPIPYDLPQRTAKGRQSRLKTEIAKLIEMQEYLERVHKEEGTGSLVYRRRSSYKE